MYDIAPRARVQHSDGNRTLTGLVVRRCKHGVYVSIDPNPYDIHTIGPIPYAAFFTSGSGWQLL